jgi:hypothetical protein
LTGTLTHKRPESLCRILYQAFTIAQPSNIFRLPSLEPQHLRFTIGESFLVTQIQDFIDKFMSYNPELDMTDTDGVNDPIRVS